MIPDVPRRAIAIITLPISFFHSLAVLSLPHEAATITPHTKIPPKQTRRIKVVIILVNHHINLGNAVISVTVVPPVVAPSVHILIHFPINGTLVLSFTQQQTPSAAQSRHFQSCRFLSAPLAISLSHACFATSSVLEFGVFVSTGGMTLA
jgi:hypothetical protein